MTESDEIMTDDDLHIGAFVISTPWPVVWISLLSDPWDFLVQSAPVIYLWPTSLYEIES